MINVSVWGKMHALGLLKTFFPKKENKTAHWSDAKALYDEAHEHLKMYETLYARAHAIDLAWRRGLAEGN